MSCDALSDLLRCVRVRGAVFYYVNCRDHWSAEAPPAAEIAEAVLPGCEHVMEYHMIAKGSGWAAVAGEPPVKLGAGDVVMFPRGDRHVLSHAPGAVPIPRTPEWMFATRNDPKPIPIALHHGIVESGATMPSDEASTIAICGFLGCDMRPFNPLVNALPRILHLPADHASGWIPRVMNQAATESAQRQPGGDAVLERLAEVMFVDAARRYLESLPDNATGWLAGLRDRYVGKALTLLHAEPERAWNVDALAHEVALSRSALHERFTRYVGHAPMQYLANWRIQLGAKMLRESNRNVATIALEVGYDSEAAFSRAFKRMVGVPPAAWRRARQS